MTRLLPLLALMVGCRSCEERRAARAYDDAMEELLPALEVEPVEVWAEQVARDDGGVEAWGDEHTPTVIEVPDGWDLWFTDDVPDWVYEVNDNGCPDDVPLVGPAGTYTDPWAAGDRVQLGALAGGCDASGDDMRGTYDAGYLLHGWACEAGDCSSSSMDELGHALIIEVGVILVIE